MSLLANIRQCVIPLGVVFDSNLYCNHTTRETRSDSRRGTCLHGIADYLVPILLYPIRKSSLPDTAPRSCLSGDISRRSCDDYFARSVCPLGCHSWRFRRRVVWSFGARAYSIPRDTVAWRMAERHRVGGNRVDLCRGLSDKRRAAARPNAIIELVLRAVCA